MKPFAASFALDSQKGNGDGFASWQISEGCWLCLVADAPISAMPGSAGVLSRSISNWLEQRDRGRVDAFVTAGGGPAILADLLDTCHRDMQRRDPECWAAAVMALVGNSTVHLAGRGDCAAYLRLTEGGVFRFSDTTTVAGGGLLSDAEEQPDREVLHLEEGVYVGAGECHYRAADVITLDRKSVAGLLLVSDGLEASLGVAGIQKSVETTLEESILTGKIEALNLKDDTTFLGLELTSPETVEPGIRAAEASEGPSEEIENPLAVQSSPKPGESDDHVPNRSLGRKALGFLFSLFTLALLAFVAWKMIHFYLEESLDNEPEKETPEEISAEEPEKLP